MTRRRSFLPLALAALLLIETPGFEAYAALEKTAETPSGPQAPAVPSVPELGLPAASLDAGAAADVPTAAVGEILAPAAVSAEAQPAAAAAAAPLSPPALAFPARSDRSSGAKAEPSAGDTRWQRWLNEAPRGEDDGGSVLGRPGSQSALLSPSSGVSSEAPRPATPPSASPRAGASRRRWSWSSVFLALGTASFLFIHAPQIASNVQALLAGDGSSLAVIPWTPYVIGALNNLLLLFDAVSKRKAAAGHLDALMQASAVAAVTVVLTTLWAGAVMPTWAFVSAVPLLAGGLGASYLRAKKAISPRAWTAVRSGTELLTVGALVQGAWLLATGSFAALAPGALAVASGLWAARRWERASWDRLMFWTRLGTAVYGLPAMLHQIWAHPDDLYRISLGSQLLGMWGNLFSLPQARKDGNKVWIFNSLYGGLAASGAVIGAMWWFGALGGPAFAVVLGAAAAFAAATLWMTRRRAPAVLKP